jgi:penicillin-binding protein 1A
VLNAMLEDGKITAAQAAEAKSKPIVLDLAEGSEFAGAALCGRNPPLPRSEVWQRPGSRRRAARLHLARHGSAKSARQALLDGLAAYERRHGWHGKLLNVIAQGQKLDKYVDPDWDEEPEVNGYMHALVTQVSPAAAEIRFGQHTPRSRRPMWHGRRRKLKLPILHAGDIVYIKVLALDAERKSARQPGAGFGTEGALVAIDNATGEIKAMVGGRDFNLSKFNRATQACARSGRRSSPTSIPR